MDVAGVGESTGQGVTSLQVKGTLLKNLGLPFPSPDPTNTTSVARRTLRKRPLLTHPRLMAALDQARQLPASNVGT